ncbi:MAG: DUF2281 domain-containing protein, partial [Chloroflexaceae bacterium]|nr:DUF2281 domain-containing protein [Chloroflexaceae bacterium]
MDIEQAILKQIRRLPPDQQREVLDFAAFLDHHRSTPPAYRGVKGLWADLPPVPAAAEIDAARRAAWRPPA